MAFALDQEDQNKQQQQGQNPQVQPITSSAPGAGPASAAKSAPQATPSQPFQNLSAYLTANAPQIQSQANTIAGNLTNQYGQVQSDINQGKIDFGNQVQGGYTQANPDLVSQAASNPSAFVSNPDNVKAFQSLYNDQYTGPSDFESSTGYGNLTGEVNKALEQANLVGTTGGLQTYFQNQNPTATRGGNLLDSVLLQGSPEAYTTVQNAAKPFSNLTDYLNQATTDADAGVTNAQTTAQQTAQGIQNQFTGNTGLIPTLQNQLTNSLTQTQADKQAALTKAMVDYQNGQATPDDLSLLGFNMSDLSDKALSGFSSVLQSLKNDYGVDTNINSIFNPQNPQVAYSTPGTVATPQQIKDMQALGQLTGQDLSSWLGGTTPGSLTNLNRDALSQAGQNLGARDTTTIANLAKQYAPNGQPLFGPSVSEADILTYLNSGTPQAQQFINFLQTIKDPVIKDAAQRMGFSAPPPQPGGGGIIHAS
jgi:hypothetical protein